MSADNIRTEITRSFRHDRRWFAERNVRKLRGAFPLETVRCGVTLAN